MQTVTVRLTPDDGVEQSKGGIVAIVVAISIIVLLIFAGTQLPWRR